MKDTLSDALLPPDSGDNFVFRVGTVSNDSPIEVTIAGADALSAAYLDSYTPTIDDVVLILQSKSDLIILGQIESGG